MSKKNPFNNTVRPAMQNNNNNLNTINQVRSAFSSNPNHNYLKTSSDYATMSVPYNKPFSLTNRDYQAQNNFSNSVRNILFKLIIQEMLLKKEDQE